MYDMLTIAKSELKKLIYLSFEKIFQKEILPKKDISDFLIEIPSNTSYGDFSTNVAMVNCKQFKCSPRFLAEKICENLVLDGSLFYNYSVAGAGFINFFVNNIWFKNVLSDIINKKSDYGKSDFGNNEKVMVEFVSANPTGPMHIGNSRGGAIGDCLASVLEFAGYDVTREFYINDAGNQIEKFGDSLYIRYLQCIKGEDFVSFPEDGYHGDDIKAHVNNFVQLYSDKYINTPENDAKSALINYALPINVDKLKSDLEEYRILYDVWFKESYLYEDNTISEVINIFKSKNLTYEKEGALWYNLKISGFEKDEVLIRKNKTPTYFLTDIAYHYNKFLKREYKKVINIWGADHHGHVMRLKKAMDDIGVDSSNLEIVLMQLVRIVRDGETVRVSKRTGKSITLVDLLKEVPISAARFFFNLKEANSHFDFDLDLAIEESSRNPVYYVQYAYARICNVIKKLDISDDYDINKLDIGVFEKREEIELIRHLSKFPSEIVLSAVERDPSRITKYSIELSSLFHKFYNACKVNVDNHELKHLRYIICLSVKIVLKNIFDIIKVDAVENM